MEKFDTLVLSGGGVRGFVVLGGLQYLKDIGIINEISTYIGTSIGCVISFLLMIGFEPCDIVIRFIQYKYLSRIKPASILDLFLKGDGILRYDDFNEILTEMILLKRENVPTLAEIKKDYGKNLVCVTYNYSQKKEISVCAETHPDMNVLDAMRMSCNLPFVFSHFQYDGDYYFDGFLSNNFPVHQVSPTGHAIGITAEGTMCVDTEDALDFWKIIWNLFITPIQELQSMKNAPFLDRCRVIELDMNKYSFLDYKLSSKNMLNMYSEGFSKMVSIFN
jgi:predicted acylesterase/phospholipase RssA|tara:strand:- start:79 stop:909 length:831 start_codon:yes stop_codon:yes gene_type:complete